MNINKKEIQAEDGKRLFNSKLFVKRLFTIFNFSRLIFNATSYLKSIK
jgi:hypothetical protein